MKKVVFLAMLLMTVAGTMRAQVTTYKSTDTNNDGNVNISDVTNTTNMLLGQQAKSNDMVKVDDINVLLRQINAKLNAIAAKLNINIDDIDGADDANTIPPNPSEIIAHSQERQYEDGHWENQIIIKANQLLKKGDKCSLAFDYCLSPASPISNVQEAKVNCVLDGDFSDGFVTYYSWLPLELTFKRDWQSFSETFEIPETKSEGINTAQLLSLYLSHIKEACNYHIKNVVWKIEKADGTVESLINTEGTENFYVIEGASQIRPYTPATEPQTVIDLKIEDFHNATTGGINCTSWGNDQNHIVSVKDNGVLSLYSRDGQKTSNVWDCQCNIPEQGIGIKPGVEYTLKLIQTGSPQETIPAMIRSTGENTGNFYKPFEIPITGNRSTFETTFTVPADANTNAVELALNWGQYKGEFYIFYLEVSHKE